MLALRRASHPSLQCRRLATAAKLQPIQSLPTDDIDAFRQQAFRPALPAVLPGHARDSMPAIRKWFVGDSPPELNVSYLAKFGSNSVPLEFSNGKSFARTYHSLSFFLECDSADRATITKPPHRYFSARVPGSKTVRRTRQANSYFTSKPIAVSPKVHVYLAQAPIADLPRAMRDDVPVPALVTQAAKGDVYDSSIWVGRAPTYTPLHRDPNPNLFVQLAGTKIVRMFRPDVGRAIYAKVQEDMGGSGSASIRGEEMMQGVERTLLEHEVWAEGSEYRDVAFEAELSRGDALFIPKGWWHSVRGVGTGINGSVNWWFR